MKLIHYFDAGHGWVKVSKRDLLALGLADKISGYSYQSKAGSTVKAKCQCRTFELKARRFNKILNGAKYRCLNCGSHLELLDEVG